VTGAITAMVPPSGASEVPHPTVASIWRRWGSRFTGVGVDASIVERLRETIATWDDWCVAWCAVGDDLSSFAADRAGRGHHVTAAALWEQASLAYLYAGMYFVHDETGFVRAHTGQVEAYRHAMPLLALPPTRLEVPFAGTTIPLLVQTPSRETPAPVALLFNGFEGAKEESQARVAELHARGVATASFDGPGRGETWPALPMTGDYGPVAGAVIDALAGVPGIDTSRVGALGPNRGGFLALKAAAAEPRISAVAVVGPGFDRRGTRWDDPYQVLFDKHLFHLDDDDALRDRLQQSDLNLAGDVDDIRAHVLVIAGGRDGAEHLGGSQRLYDALRGPKEWMLVPESERNGSNASYKVRPAMADFLADRLAASPSRS
jgi:dienelactone hydrolase